MSKIIVGGVEFTPEQINALKAQTQIQGESSVGDIFDNSADTTPRIGASSPVTKPTIRSNTGEAIPSQRVTRPSSKFVERSASHQQEAAKARLAEIEAQHQAQIDQDPKALHNKIQYLERAVKRLEKALKEKE